MPIVFPPNLIQLGGGNVTVNADGSITLAPAASTNVTLSSGQLKLPDGTSSAPALVFSATDTGLHHTSGRIFITSSTVRAAGFDVTGGIIGPGLSLSFGNTGFSDADVFLRRDAANILAQRNGVNAQEQRWYNTFTDSSNYERGFARWSSNEFRLGAEAAGTGTARECRLVSGTGFSFSFPSTRSLRVDSNYVTLGSGIDLSFSGTADVSSGDGDVGLRRIAAGVLGVVTTANTFQGWFQSSAGRARVTADVTNATATMSNLTDLSITLKAGRKYVGQFVFFANDSTGADGLAFDLNGGAATFTSLEFGFTAQPAGSTLGTVTSTAAGTAITLTVVSTSDAVYTVSFACVCNAAGTFIPRVAQNSHSTGTATVRLGSYVIVEDSPS